MLQKQTGATPKHTANPQDLKLKSADSSMLLDELEGFSRDPGHAAIDPDAVIACLDQLDELSPMDASFDVEASLADFRAQHREVFPKKCPPKRRRILLHRARWLAAAAAVVLLCGTMLASAFDVDFMDFIARWTDETFGFELKRHKVENIVMEKVSNTPKFFFPSLEDALASCGVTEQVVPTWIPEGFTLDSEGAFITVSDLKVSIHAWYWNGDRDGDDFMIIIDKFEDASAAMSGSGEIIKDEREPHTVELGGITHYFFWNNDEYVCAWTNGSLVCHIAGNVSETQLLKIVESIYEGGQTVK